MCKEAKADTFPYAKATVYQIALRSFTPEGTIAAATKLLPFIAGFGPAYVQLCPVVEADPDTDRQFWSKRQKASGTENPKNSYRIRDYFSIDAEYGTDEDLLEFVKTAHTNGIKVILDLVYYHCGPTAVFLEQHPDFVRRNADGTPDCGEWGFPVLNYECRELREYLWGNMCYFVEKFDIDGYRCDVGDKAPLDFWAEGIRRIRSIKQDLFMINEGRNPEYLQSFDVNYFYDGCFDAPKIAAGELPAGMFREKWLACREALPSGGRVLRFIDNHDVASDSYENRHEKVLGPDGVEVLLVLDYTLDGIPFLFCGYEVMDDLKHNMFANRTYGRDAAVNWANALTKRGLQRLKLVTRLHHMRTEYEALCSDRLDWLTTDAPEAVLAYRRQAGEEKLLVVLNLSKKPVSVKVDAKLYAPAAAEPLLEKGMSYHFEKGSLLADILPYGYLVVKQ